MPQLMSMKDFLAGGGAAVTTYKNTGVLPSYVARPRTTRPKTAGALAKPRMPRQGKGSKPNPFSVGASTMKKKQRSRSASPLKKKKRAPARKRTMPKY
jgi:hypothetical protein